MRYVPLIKATKSLIFGKELLLASTHPVGRSPSSTTIIFLSKGGFTVIAWRAWRSSFRPSRDRTNSSTCLGVKVVRLGYFSLQNSLNDCKAYALVLRVLIAYAFNCNSTWNSVAKIFRITSGISVHLMSDPSCCAMYPPTSTVSCLMEADDAGGGGSTLTAGPDEGSPMEEEEEDV